MNTEDDARRARRAHDAQAADLLRATAFGQPLEDMPPDLAYWYRRDLQLRIGDVMGGRADRDENLEAEAIRTHVIQPPPGHGGHITLVQ